MLKSELTDIWIMHHSVEDWSDRSVWRSYFEAAQDVVRSTLTHLDAADPVRRKVESLDQAASFVTTFPKGAETRWLFGKFSKVGFRFTIHYYETSLVGRFLNSCNWYIPGSFIHERGGVEIINKLLELGAKSLGTFYSISDDIKYITQKKKQYGVKLEEELLGIFWLNYFNEKYVDFFGMEKLHQLGGVEFRPREGATLKLGQSPDEVPDGRREACERLLGYSSFVDPHDPRRKPVGQYVLSYAQLRDRDCGAEGEP